MIRTLQENESIPSHGDDGGPLVSVIIHYEDGTQIRVSPDRLRPLSLDAWLKSEEGRRHTDNLVFVPSSVRIIDPYKLPTPFIDRDYSIKPRLDDIERALLAGDEVPGAELVDSNQNKLKEA